MTHIFALYLHAQNLNFYPTYGQYSSLYNDSLINQTFMIFQILYLDSSLLYLQWQMSILCHLKLTNVIMFVRISVMNSTIQPPAPKLSKVHFNILKLKNNPWPNFLSTSCLFIHWCIIKVDAQTIFGINPDIYGFDLKVEIKTIC